MKILLMEKFDGISSEIPTLNGRDPRIELLEINPSANGFFRVAQEGLVVKNTGTVQYRSVLRYEINIVGLSDLRRDSNQRYSITMNGLCVQVRANNPGGSMATNERLTISGVDLANGDQLSRGVTVRPFVNFKLSPSHSQEVFNLEIVEQDGMLEFYKNGNLTYTEEGLLTDKLIDISLTSVTGSGGHMNHKELFFELSELILVELEEGERRAGNVRLERLPVKTTSENTPNPENITPVNLADNTYSTIGEDEVGITVESPTISKHEKIIGIDYRTSAVSSIDGSQMRVRLLNGEEELHNKVEHLPQTHTRASSCQVIPAKYLGDNPEDYEDVKLVIKATEDEE